MPRPQICETNLHVIGCGGTCGARQKAYDQGVLETVRVGGEYVEKTLNEHVLACNALLFEEQQKANPDNALVAVLCDSVRLVRECARLAKRGLAIEPDDQARSEGERTAAQERADVVAWLQELAPHDSHQHGLAIRIYNSEHVGAAARKAGSE